MLRSRLGRMCDSDTAAYTVSCSPCGFAVLFEPPHAAAAKTTSRSAPSLFIAPPALAATLPSRSQLENSLPALGFAEPGDAEPDEDSDYDDSHLEQHQTAADALVAERRQSPCLRRGRIAVVVRVTCPQEDVRERGAYGPDEAERGDSRTTAEGARARERLQKSTPEQAAHGKEEN